MGRRGQPFSKQLRMGFRDGVDERYGPRCWLALHDMRMRPCSGSFERFHFIGRQRLRHALAALLYDSHPLRDIGDFTREELLLLAEWDSRNGGIACEQHHRRFDNHLTPSLVVPALALPAHVIEYAEDWGLELEIEKKFGRSPKQTERGRAA